MVQQTNARPAAVIDAVEQRAPATMSEGKRRWFEQEIKRLVRSDASAFPPGRSDRTERDRVEIVLQAYCDLWALRYRIDKPESLRPAHLSALVAMWRAKKLSRETALVRWCRLRAWCVVIGKAGMAPDLGTLWSASEPVDVVRAPTRSTEALSQQQYEFVIAELQAKGKETSYWLVRCVRELELCREEAVLLEPARAVTPGDAAVVVYMGKGDEQRVVALDTPEKKALISAVREFVISRSRHRLGWPDISLAAMKKKYSNQVAYQVRKRWGANAVAPSGTDCAISTAAVLATPDSGSVVLTGARVAAGVTNTANVL